MKEGLMLADLRINLHEVYENHLLEREYQIKTEGLQLILKKRLKYWVFLGQGKITSLILPLQELSILKSIHQT